MQVSHSDITTPKFYGRAWFQACFQQILDGWYRALEATSPSGAVWESQDGLRYDYFVSQSGKQCDGVTRMLPALAAWAAQPENPDVLVLADQRHINPKELIRNAFVHATDPDHPDFWGYAPAHRSNQRQVESSIVAWSLWLSRDWLLPELTPQQIGNIQAWLASCTAFTDHFNNWSLFTAVNHAARLALAEYGFSGDWDALRRDLIPGDEVALADGWLWDKKYSGIDYYNFWVYSSHHCYLKAMLPEYENPMLDRALARMVQRLADLPFLIDAQGRNVLFGRSLSYRWGWLNGLIAAHAIDHSPLDPGLSRVMLARNLEAWLRDGALNKHGVIGERLSPRGSDGGRSGYINCGHPYWGMQSFLCLAFAPQHPFWSAPPQPLPVDTGEFVEARQGPGFVFQGLQPGGEVRLFNLRNLNHDGNALYEKFVYSTAFPCNALSPGHQTLWDTQFGLRLADGTQLAPSDIAEVDVNDGRELHLIWRFDGATFAVVVHTTLRIDGEWYETEHQIETQGEIPPGALWLEGGFALGLAQDETVECHVDGLQGVAERGDRRAIITQCIRGWDQIHTCSSREPHSFRFGVASPDAAQPNILYGESLHYVLSSPVQGGRAVLAARHAAGLDGTALRART